MDQAKRETDRPATARETAAMKRGYYIHERPAGDYAVQKFANGQIIRWGVYPTREEAEEQLKMAKYSEV